jgi:dethiobiotin synthetase
MKRLKKPATDLAAFVRKKKLHAVFVTGTDTHMGKTFVTTNLIRRLQEQGLRVAAMKPVACGTCGRDDALSYWKLAGKRIPLSTINPYWFRKPLAPVAQKSKPNISLPRIRGLFRSLQKKHDIVLVESAGGLLTPLTWSMSVRDLARSLQLPVVVVARAGLGTLNHTILTVEAARHAGLKIKAIVLNDQDGKNAKAAAGNRRVLARLLKVPVLLEPYR